MCDVVRTFVRNDNRTSLYGNLTVTCQYTESWKIHSHILAMRVLDSKQGDNIRTAVKSVLEEFSVLRPSNVYIMDNASNMNAAFREDT